jgi:hypothetical protein
MNLFHILRSVKKMSQDLNAENLIGPDSQQFSFDGEEQGMAAWTEIEAGRFMPRRVRGSCQGRALG